MTHVLQLSCSDVGDEVQTVAAPKPLATLAGPNGQRRQRKRKRVIEAPLRRSRRSGATPSTWGHEIATDVEAHFVGPYPADGGWESCRVLRTGADGRLDVECRKDGLVVRGVRPNLVRQRQPPPQQSVVPSTEDDRAFGPTPSGEGGAPPSRATEKTVAQKRRSVRATDQVRATPPPTRPFALCLGRPVLPCFPASFLP